MLTIRLKTLTALALFGVTALSLEGCTSAMHSGFHGLRWRHGQSKNELCEPSTPYLQARSVPTVRVGDGLTPPNTKNTLQIPVVEAEARARTVQEGCLANPPAFDSGSKAKPKSATDKSAKPAHDAPVN
jgi:hypothetical protein